MLCEFLLYRSHNNSKVRRLLLIHFLLIFTLQHYKGMHNSIAVLYVNHKAVVSNLTLFIAAALLKHSVPS